MTKIINLLFSKQGLLLFLLRPQGLQLFFNSLLKPQGLFLFFNSKKKEAKNAAAYGKKLKINVFSKNRELASLRQHGFLDEKIIDFLNAFFLRREYSQ
ncbi:MAG: hypothetical protein R6W67_10360, partial [Bacteroidales bacterium]